MPKRRSWTDEQLINAVKAGRSNRSVLIALSLIPAGGNYDQIRNRIAYLKLDSSHFTSQGWNKGGSGTRKPQPLNELLVKDSNVQSFKLKNKLFVAGLRSPKCELCDWSERSVDGRIPVELDHINGDHQDSRLVNLRILCPNCHSLQITHRGRNKKTTHVRVVE